MDEKEKLPRLNRNLVINNTLFNDVLDLMWIRLAVPEDTSELRLSIVKLDFRFAWPILQQYIHDPVFHHVPDDINHFPFPGRMILPITSDPFSKGEPIWSGVFPKDTRAVRIQLSKRASELDGEYLGFTLNSCDESGVVRGQALMVIKFVHTPYFSCSPTSSAANFIRNDSFRWPLSMLEKFNKIPCSDIKTVVDKYKAVYFAMSLISSSPYDWDSTNKIKDDCYCFEYDNNAYLISKEFWLLYEILLDSKKGRANENLSDQSNLAVKLLENQLDDIWNKRYFYKLESIPAAVLKWENVLNAVSYSVKRFSRKRNCLCPIVKDQKTTTCEDLDYNDAKYYELDTGTSVYKYDCEPFQPLIVV